MLIERIDAALIARARKEDAERGSPLRLSNSGICARRLGYQLHKVPHDEPLSPRLSRTFDFGHVTEALVRAWLAEAGVVVHDAQLSGVLDCGDKLLVTGHLDAIVEYADERWVLEVKSINTDGFQRTQKGEVEYSYLCQANAYMEVSGCGKALILFVDKNDQELLEKPLVKDVAIIDQIRARFHRVAASTPDKLPDREHEAVDETEFKRGKAPVGTPIANVYKSGWKKPTGRKVLGFPCTYCQWKEPCWGVGAPEINGGKLTWVLEETVLGAFMK